LKAEGVEGGPMRPPAPAEQRRLNVSYDPTRELSQMFRREMGGAERRGDRGARFAWLSPRA
jgi:hypothetical protein